MQIADCKLANYQSAICNYHAGPNVLRIESFSKNNLETLTLYTGELGRACGVE